MQESSDKKTIQLNVTDEFLVKLMALKYNHDKEGYDIKRESLIKDFQESLNTIDKNKSIESLKQLQVLTLDRVIIIESLIELASNLESEISTEIKEESKPTLVAEADENESFALGEVGKNGGTLDMKTGEWSKKD
jgi:hypothetical protein